MALAGPRVDVQIPPPVRVAARASALELDVADLAPPVLRDRDRFEVQRVHAVARPADVIALVALANLAPHEPIHDAVRVDLAGAERVARAELRVAVGPVRADRPTLEDRPPSDEPGTERRSRFCLVVRVGVGAGRTPGDRLAFGHSPIIPGSSTVPEIRGVIGASHPRTHRSPSRCQWHCPAAAASAAFHTVPSIKVAWKYANAASTSSATSFWQWAHFAPVSSRRASASAAAIGLGACST